MKEILLQEITELHSNYQSFKILMQEQQAKITKSKDQVLSADTNPSPEALEKLYTDYYVDLVLFSSDLQLISAKLGFYIDLYIKNGLGELPEQVAEFYNEHKKNFPKQTFVVKDGKFTEGEDGLLEEKRKQFLHSDFYKNMQKMLS